MNTGKYKEYLAEQIARMEKERKAKERLTIKLGKEELKKWLAGEIDKRWSRFDLFDYLRVIERTEDKKHVKRIETSQGIELPIETARRDYNQVKLLLASGGCQGGCNFRILSYEVKQVNVDFIEVGCHTIKMSELDRIASILKW